MPMPNDDRDREKSVVAIFKQHAMHNDRKSVEAGRPIYDDIVICELHYPGRRDWSAHPATAMSHWESDENGNNRPITYAERFAKQFQQFMSHEQQTKTGTPLDYLPFLTEGKRAMLRALNVYTCEALAEVDGAELKHFGPGGREMKNAAQQFLEESVSEARFTKMQADIEALLAKNQTLTDDLAAMRVQAANDNAGAYADMSDEQLREHVKAISGIEPRGNLPRKTLLRMLKEQEEASAA